MSRITDEAIERGVGMWARETHAFTGSGRPDVGNLLDTHNSEISRVARSICSAVAQAIGEAEARSVWCDDQEQGCLALSNGLQGSSLATVLPQQLEDLGRLVGGNERYEQTFTPFIEEAAGLLEPESDSQGRLLRQVCLENDLR